MKRFNLITLFSIWLLTSFGQSDTGMSAKMDAVVKNMASVKDSLTALSNKASFISSCYNCKDPLTIQQFIMVFAPVILFLIGAVYASIRLKRKNFFLADALTEKDPTLITIQNPKYDPTNPTTPATINISNYPKSSSRVIAFFSGMAAIIIAVCTVSYFFYMYFRTGVAPELDKLFNILLALGIGVTPYAVNKIGEAFKK
jgi:hypothetical protein